MRTYRHGALEFQRSSWQRDAVKFWGGGLYSEAGGMMAGMVGIKFEG